MTIALSPPVLYAGEVFLNNGDRITGELIHLNERDYIVKTQGVGIVQIARDTVKEIKGAEIEAGYSQTSGNTKTRDISGRIFVNRKVEKKNEITAEAKSIYAGRDRKMITQKHYAMARYAYSFGESKKWYNFYKTEGAHDRFANIDYRVIPSTGLGYWFSDADSFKALTEVGVGFAHTKFRDDTEDKDELVLVPRLYLEKRLIGESRVSQDIFAYPEITDFGAFRLHSETRLDNPINDYLKLRLSLIDDYNTDPGDDVRRNDLRLESSVAVSF
ncbi:MAG: DUF481 domain-containing protein [Candidatus Omnitrophota bacterium]|nr:DUF481 domain-containing protein [Candidatus Omnitrophota bacterium]